MIGCGVDWPFGNFAQDFNLTGARKVQFGQTILQVQTEAQIFPSLRNKLKLCKQSCLTELTQPLKRLKQKKVFDGYGDFGAAFTRAA